VTTVSVSPLAIPAIVAAPGIAAMARIIAGGAAAKANAATDRLYRLVERMIDEHRVARA
jgi:hypothetical protein